jgi:ABC-type dipeptide/oligopeptide/nickel transport system permease subunit
VLKSKKDIYQEFMEAPPRVSAFKRFIRVFFGRRIVIVGIFILIVLMVMAIFAPWLAPYDPYSQDLDNVLAKPSVEHWLGTDSLGRDTLSRIIYGSQTSLIIGLVAIFFASSVGNAMGLIAGYFGGWTYTIIMRLIDGLMAIPMIMLALVIAALLGKGLVNIVIALGIAMIPPYARLMCGQVLSIKEKDYILAERSLGAGNIRIMLQHITPNAFPPLIVLATMMIGSAILAEAILSFLGIGITEPSAAWGAMVNEGYRYLLTLPILSFVPGIAIMLVVFAFNMVGDGLRDALDPRLRGTL